MWARLALHRDSVNGQTWKKTATCPPAGRSVAIDRSNSVALIVKVQGATGIQPVDISMGMRDSNQARRANTFIMRDLQGIELVLVRRRGRNRRSKQAQTPARTPHAPFNSIWLGGRDSNPDNVVQSHVSYR